MKLNVVLVLFAFSLLSFKGDIPLEIKTVLDGKISLKIPAGFEIMDEDFLKIKYPTGNRPAVAYTNETGGINVAFNHTQNPASQEQLPQYQEQFVKTFKAIYKGAEWHGSGIREVNGRKVGHVELITQAADSKIYNLIFFTDVEGKLLICTFNCMEKHLGDWSSVGHEIMRSLKVKS